MKLRLFVSLLLTVLMVLNACDKNEFLNSLISDKIDISEEQETELIANGLSQSTGGLMTAFQMAGQLSDSSFYKFGKVDTAFTVQWVHFEAALGFYMANGTEVPLFIPGLVDRIVADTRMSGDSSYTYQHRDGNWNITLNSHSSLNVSNITSTTLTINGTGTDSSDLVYTTSSVNLDIESHSNYRIENIKIPISGANYFPSAGRITGTAAGTVHSDDMTKEISIPYEAQFRGNSEVLVTMLENGRQFILNLSSSEISEP